MIEHPSKSKGYLPIKSGPNQTGFYMGNSNSLMEMMQTGGSIPSAYKKSFSLTGTPGGATLARALQRRKDTDKLEDYQREEAKRQERGALFGGVLKTGLGLLGSAIAGPAGAGFGTALGSRIGEGIGAGKSREYDSSGTVFGQQAFRDVERASRDYTRGMGERALVSGLQAGLTAGFSPDGGIYGETSRRAGGLRPALAGAVGYGGASLPSVPEIDTGIMDAYFSGNPLTSGSFLPGLQEGGQVQRGALMQAFKEADKNRDAIMALAKERILGDEAQQYSPESASYLEQAGLLGMTKGMSKEDLEDRALLREQIKSREGLDDMMFNLDPTLGFGDVSVTQSLAPKRLRMSDNPLTSDISSLRAISTFNPPEGSTLDSARFLRSVLPSLYDVEVGPISVYGSPTFGMKDGGLIEYQNGGSVDVQNILQDAGITATPQQLALFESFDPTELTQATEAISDSLLGMTSGQGLASAGTGFGARTSAIGETVARGQESLEQQRQAQQKAFESQTLGQAASMVDQDVEFGAFVAPPPTVSTLPTADQGPVTFNGVGYVWDNDSGQYITQDQFEQGMSTYYDDMYD